MKSLGDELFRLPAPNSLCYDLKSAGRGYQLVIIEKRFPVPPFQLGKGARGIGRHDSINRHPFPTQEEASPQNPVPLPTQEEATPQNPVPLPTQEEATPQNPVPLPTMGRG